MALTINNRKRICMKNLVFSCVALLITIQSAIAADAHAALLGFVSPEGLLMDYLGELPTAEDCAMCRPNAKGWWTPIENGPMFTGPWLEAVCARAKRTGLAEDRALARRLAGGLLAASRCSKTPGFIARGLAKDGAHYPVGSIDQTLPWFYGLYAYWKSGLAEPKEADEIRAQMLKIARELESNGWKCPCEPPFDKESCGDFVNDSLPFRNAAHGLFLFRVLAEFEPERKAFYDRLARSAAAGTTLTRLEVCAKGYETDIPKLPSLEPNLLWIYATAQGCLRVLSELEPDESAFRAGLKANAARAKRFIALAERYDNSAERPFKYANWRTGYVWRPQKTLAESDAVSWTGRQSVLGTRKDFERDSMTAPLSAAAICAYAGEAREEVRTALSRYDWTTLNISEFFWAEIASEQLRPR